MGVLHPPLPTEARAAAAATRQRAAAPRARMVAAKMVNLGLTSAADARLLPAPSNVVVPPDALPPLPEGLVNQLSAASLAGVRGGEEGTQEASLG